MESNNIIQSNVFSNEEERKYKADLDCNLEEDNIKNIFSLDKEERQENGEFLEEIHDYIFENERQIQENIDTILSDLFPMDFFSICKIDSDDFSSINIQNQKTKYSTNNNFFFNVNKEKTIFSGKKRKKELKEGEERHNKYFPDNILRKIQVHSINYIFDFINELLNIKGYKDQFLNISYNFKKVINKKQVMKLKQSLIGDILNQNISEKYRTKCIENIESNMKLFNRVNNDKDIRQILNETYLTIFRNYYLENKKEVIINGLYFELKKPKTVEDLLSKYNEDKRYKYMINEVIKKNYLPKKQFKI